MGSNHGVVDVHIGFGNFVEHFDGERNLSAERESGDEFGHDVMVVVKMGSDNLGMNLLYLD